jgi:hypothetical protein
LKEPKLAKQRLDKANLEIQNLQQTKVQEPENSQTGPLRIFSAASWCDEFSWSDSA